MIYTVWTGTKLKGYWETKDQALRYAATRGEEVVILEIDTTRRVPQDEVLAMAKHMQDEIDENKKALGEVHHLKAKGLSAQGKGQVKSIN